MTYISKELEREVRFEAKNRCGYCLGEQRYIFTWLEIEHIFPKAKGGKSTKENLWLACRFCNTFKSSQTHAPDPKTKELTKIFNPRTQNWQEHFKFNRNKSEIIGKTLCGRATVAALQINNDLAVDTRKEWVKVGWYPPKD